MRILVLCDEGNKRSVVLGHQLKYLGHDVLTAGLKRNKLETLQLLMNDWAELVIITDRHQIELLPTSLVKVVKVALWDIGPDEYPQPFHPTLLAKCKKLIKENPL